MISKDRLAAIYYRAFPSRMGERGLDSVFFFGSAKDIDWGGIAQDTAMEHLMACHEALQLRDDGEEPEYDPACAPFCGCEVCTVREVLYSSWGTIANATRAGVQVDYTGAP